MHYFNARRRSSVRRGRRDAHHWLREMGKRVPRDTGEGGEHSGVFGFVGELIGGELWPAGAVVIMNGGSRGGEGEGWADLALGLDCSWASLGQPKRKGEGEENLGRFGSSP
jgi:hypothetical protein